MPASPHTWVLDILKAYRARAASRTASLYIPKLDGILRHSPGKLLHVMPELFFQLEGVNRIDFPSHRHLLQPGRACLIPRGLPHGESFQPVRGQFRMLVLVFIGDHIDYHLCATKRDGKSYPERGGRVTTAEGIRIAAALDDLTRLSQHPDAWGAAATRDLWLGILAWLGFALNAPPEAPRHSPKVGQALFLIAQQLENPGLGAAALAERIGCAPNYLSNLFHKETGTSLVRHIQGERILKAQYLLDHSAMSVKEIAHACGLGTPSYFARLFHRLTGLSPSQFRLNQQGAAAH